MSQPRSWAWIPLGVLSLTTVLALAGAEVVLRVLVPEVRRPFDLHDHADSSRGKFCRYDRSLGWVGLPSVTDDFQFLDCRSRVVQNRHGFRGTAHPFGRGSRPRTVVLGDSFVWGFGVEEDEIFTSVLEAESRGDTDVVNLGVSGYGTDQQLLMWRHFGRRFAPDRVISVVTTYTDFWENRVGEAYGYPKPYFSRSASGHLRLQNQPVPRSNDLDSASSRRARPRLARWASWSALLSAGLTAVARIDPIRQSLEERRILLPRGRAMGWPRDLFSEPATDQAEKSWEMLFALVEQMQLEVESTGATFSLLPVPAMVEIYPEVWSAYLEGLPAGQAHGLSPDAPRRRIAEFCRERGITLIDPTGALQSAAHTNPDLYFPVNAHWTAAGHRIVAEVVHRLAPPVPSPARP